MMEQGTAQNSLLATALRARREGLAPTLLLVLGGVAFLALLAQVRVQIGPVPLTGQTFGVLLLGAAYGARRGALTTGTYALLGLLGVPLFAGGGAGWGHLLGPTGGYLLGFVLAAGLVGWLASLGWDRRLGSALAAMVLGSIVIYVSGVAWLTPLLGGDLRAALTVGVLPFLAGDAIKVGLAAALMPAVWGFLGRR